MYHSFQDGQICGRDAFNWSAKYCIICFRVKYYTLICMTGLFCCGRSRKKINRQVIFTGKHFSCPVEKVCGAGREHTNINHPITQVEGCEGTVGEAAGRGTEVRELDVRSSKPPRPHSLLARV